MSSTSRDARINQSSFDDAIERVEMASASVTCLIFEQLDYSDTWEPVVAKLSEQLRAQSKDTLTCSGAARDDDFLKHALFELNKEKSSSGFLSEESTDRDVGIWADVVFEGKSCMPGVGRYVDINLSEVEQSVEAYLEQESDQDSKNGRDVASDDEKGQHSKGGREVESDQEKDQDDNDGPEAGSDDEEDQESISGSEVGSNQESDQEKDQDSNIGTEAGSDDEEDQDSTSGSEVESNEDDEEDSEGDEELEAARLSPILEEEP